MKVLIPESISEIGVDKLRNTKGFEVDYIPTLSYTDVLKIIEKYDIIITRSGTSITEELLEKAKKLKLVGRAGIGVDNIDIPACSKRGILVVNVPAGNIIAATEHSIAMMLATTRQIPQADLSIRQGKWDRKTFMGVELYRKTLGIVGFGKIGSRLCKRLKAFEMNVIAYDPYVKAERIESFGAVSVSLETLLQESDFITVHTPLTDETKGMIGDKEFALMKPTARLVNCARGGIYDETALYNALKNKKIAAAAVDVFMSEPLKDSPFKDLTNIVLTPHLGANTEEAQDNVSIEIAEQVIEFKKSGFIASAINAPFSDVELAEKIGPYMKLTEKMAYILENLSEGAITEITISIEGFDSEASKPLSVSAVKGLLEPVLGETVNYVNALYEAAERSIDVKWLYNAQAKDFHSLVSLEVKTKKHVYKISGTCFGNTHPRIISINDYQVELKPEGLLLLVTNNDVPGVIGQIGTLFGVFNINIAEYRLARSADSKKALAAILLDQRPDKIVMKKLNEINGVTSTHLIQL